jgi:hypothetical protein
MSLHPRANLAPTTDTNKPYKVRVLTMPRETSAAPASTADTPAVIDGLQLSAPVSVAMKKSSLASRKAIHNSTSRIWIALTFFHSERLPRNGLEQLCHGPIKFSREQDSCRFHL